MSEFAPLLSTPSSPPPNAPAVIHPIFSDLESQAAYFRTIEEQEADSLRRLHQRAVINTIIVVAMVVIGVLVIGLLAFLGGIVENLIALCAFAYISAGIVAKRGVGKNPAPAGEAYGHW